jgi:hypothetical protein
MRYEYSRKPRKCPACRSPNVADILYGLIALSPKLEKDLSAGRIILGGCCVTGDDPKWQCTECQTVIYRKKPKPKAKKK